MSVGVGYTLEGRVYVRDSVTARVWIFPLETAREAAAECEALAADGRPCALIEVSTDDGEGFRYAGAPADLRSFAALLRAQATAASQWVGGGHA